MTAEKRTQWGLLILRLSSGGFMLTHGWAKLINFATYAEKFPDPIGVGPTVSLVLAIFAELVCAAAVVLGIGTRYAAIPLLFTMLVAAFVVHGGDPFGKKELALLYAACYAVLILAGGGQYALGVKLRVWLARPG